MRGDNNMNYQNLTLARENGIGIVTIKPFKAFNFLNIEVFIELDNMFKDIVIVRGGGDLATGTIQKLHRSGFKVLVLEVPKPTSIRRDVSFSEAIYENEVEVEGITAVHVYSLNVVVIPYS